jgi:hypothetical protein
MGKKGSTRWNDYEKAPLVEETVCIDLVALRKIGILNPGAPKWVSWTRPSSETPVAEGFVYLEIERSGTRWLVAMIALFGKPKRSHELSFHRPRVRSRSIAELWPQRLSRSSMRTQPTP